jgi:stage II sporulation protein P
MGSGFMRKSNKSDYIIMALMALVALNIGAIIIGIYPSRAETFNPMKNSFNIISESVNHLKGSLNIKETLNKTIGFLFPLEEVSLSTDEDLLHDQIEDSEVDIGEDIIIDRLDEYESLIIVKDSDGTNMVENIPEPFMINKVKIDKNSPYILLYHTHATESYLPAREGNFHVSDKNYNVLGLGEIVTTVLEASGHKVDHVQTYHDLPSYNKSYSRSLNTINKKNEESNNLKFLFDFHRDAVDESASNIESVKAKSKINIDGKSVATFSIVVGPDSPNKDQVLNFAKYIKAVSDTLYPGLCKGILIKPRGKYNQHMSDYSSLIEIGYNVNTIEEANEGAKLVGEVLSLVISSVIEE